MFAALSGKLKTMNSHNLTWFYCSGFLVQAVRLLLSSSSAHHVASFFKSLYCSVNACSGVVARALVATVKVVRSVSIGGCFNKGCVVLGGALRCVLNVASFKRIMLSNNKANHNNSLRSLGRSKLRPCLRRYLES